jgi:hypothetical protein
MFSFLKRHKPVYEIPEPEAVRGFFVFIFLHMHSVLNPNKQANTTAIKVPITSAINFL